jgi:hypothetical protein
MWVGQEHCSCGLAVEDRTSQAYNEEAFRHFLAVERKRSGRAGRSFLLLLVSMRTGPGDVVPIATPTAGRLFAALSECVREVDFIGWYRAERIAGAVLIQGDRPEPDAARRINERVTAVLRNRLPAHVAERLDVRVLHRVGGLKR